MHTRSNFQKAHELSKMADESDKHIQAKFFTKVKRYSVSDAPFSVPSNVGREELNSLINGLLLEETDSSDGGTVAEFDFLVNGEFLNETLEKHIETRNISTETVVEIEYLEKHPVPQPNNILVHDDWVSSVAVCSNCLLSGSYDNSVYVWGVDGSQLASLESHTAPVKSVDWIRKDKDRGVFVSASQDQSIHLSEWVYDKETIDCIHICKGHSQSVDCLAVNPGKDKFCSGSWDKTIKLWSAVPDLSSSDEPDLDSGKITKKLKTQEKKATTRTPLMTLSGHTEAVSTVLWLSSREVCSAGWDHCIRIWDINAGVNKHTLTGSKVFCDVSYSPHSAMLASASADKYVRLWDPRSAEGMVIKSTLVSHEGWVSSVDWSPVSEYELVSGSYDCSVKLWDTRSLSSPLFTLTGHQDKVMCVAWGVPKLIVSGGSDNQLILYDVQGGALAQVGVDSETELWSSKQGYKQEDTTQADDNPRDKWVLFPVGR